MRECNEYEITLEKFLKVVHFYTEKMAIYVVIGDTWLENREIKGIKNLHDFYLTEDAYADRERLLKYYKDVPVWNLHIELDRARYYGEKYASIKYLVVANCKFRDIRDAYLQEKKDKS